MENIKSIGVMARVKEPYSICREMLKIGKEAGGIETCKLSILDIVNAVATRVVFQARKLSKDESDSTTGHREEELCY